MALITKRIAAKRQLAGIETMKPIPKAVSKDLKSMEMSLSTFCPKATITQL
jgi:hypothetical protein